MLSRTGGPAHEVLDVGTAAVVQAGKCVHVRGYPTCISPAHVAWGKHCFSPCCTQLQSKQGGYLVKKVHFDELSNDAEYAFS